MGLGTTARERDSFQGFFQPSFGTGTRKQGNGCGISLILPARHGARKGLLWIPALVHDIHEPSNLWKME